MKLADLQSSSATFEWKPSSVAVDSYRVSLKVFNDFEQEFILAFEASHTENPFITLKNLQPDTNYKLEINGLNRIGIGPQNRPFFFRSAPNETHELYSWGAIAATGHVEEGLENDKFYEKKNGFLKVPRKVTQLAQNVASISVQNGTMAAVCMLNGRPVIAQCGQTWDANEGVPP